MCQCGDFFGTLIETLHGLCAGCYFAQMIRENEEARLRLKAMRRRPSDD